MNKRAKIIKFVNSNRQQIIFALFALLYIFDNRVDNVYASAAPAVAAAAAKAAKAVKAAKTAKQGGETAKAAKEVATAAKHANEAIGAAKQAHDAKNIQTDDDARKAQRKANRRMLANAALTAATGMGGLGLASKANDKINLPNKNQNIPRNTNPNPEAFSNKKNDNFSEETSSIKGRGGLRNLFRGGNVGGKSDSVGMDNASEVVSNGGGFAKIGCFFGLGFVLILLIPVIIFSEISNTFTAANYLNDIAVEEENTNIFNNLFEKFNNYFKFHYFASNKDTFYSKINEAYEEAYQKYGIPIDIPLLSATLLVDLDSLIPETDDTNQMVINKKTMNRLNYVNDLVELQINEGEDIYICSSKEVDGKKVYYSLLYTEPVVESSIISGTCNESNVGKYLRSTSTKIDVEKYYEKLKDNVVLTLLYPEYEQSISAKVDAIRLNYSLLETMYLNSYDEGDGIPGDLLYDTEINMRAPLRGKITITSPFGGRGNIYKDGVLIASGGHNGIDLYAADKTIYAAGNGVVYRTYYESTGGNIVEILHTTMGGKQYISQYAHLSQILVSKGEEVNTGDVIAIMGCSGSACTGTHLHFGIRDLDTNEWYNPKAIVQRSFN